MTIKSILILSAVATVAVFAGCKTPAPGATRSAAADTIYTGGDIITVNDAQPAAEALAVRDGKILAVGVRSEIDRAYKGPNTTVVDLAGKTLVPGFLDPHSIVAELKRFRDEHEIPKGELIQAYGYDENAMPNGVGLSRDDLDVD